jgi:hypothetical protein
MKAEQLLSLKMKRLYKSKRSKSKSKNNNTSSSKNSFSNGKINVKINGTMSRPQGYLFPRTLPVLLFPCRPFFLLVILHQ